MFWADSRLEQREGLFLPEASQNRLNAVEAADLDPTNRTAAPSPDEGLGEPDPEVPDMVAAACRGIADWVEREGKGATALAFMQAAALSDERNPELAFLTARRGNDRAWYALAMIGLGNLYFQRGDFPSARRCHPKASGIARKFRLQDIAGGGHPTISS
jgi:hypothetical protein